MIYDRKDTIQNCTNHEIKGYQILYHTQIISIQSSTEAHSGEKEREHKLAPIVIQKSEVSLETFDIQLGHSQDYTQE